MKRLMLFLCCLAFLFYASPSFGLSVTASSDPSVLIGEILGSGITVVPGSESYLGGINVPSSGTFTGGIASGIGMESGIILSSGDINYAPGPNLADGSTGYLGTGGDADLNALIPQSTNDVTYLQFDFTTTGGDLYFNYVFASEEYNEFVNSSFNDVFAFFLDGVNIALIPGTSTPVSINNINGGNPYTGTGPNSMYYNNNDPSDGGPFYDLGYDGFTDVFTAQALGLTAGNHTIKLAIADAGDSALDSAVFIQGGTFSDEPPDGSVPEPTTMLLLGTGLMAVAGIRRKFSR